MTADDDDPQLQSLRSIWKSMGDEEPSDRGLGALMAAARAKAEEMKPREAWWKRVLVQLRQPPALALATIVLLVGGGVVISQRKDMKATATVEEASGSSAEATVTAPMEPPTAGESEARFEEKAAPLKQDHAAEPTADGAAPGAGAPAQSTVAPAPRPETQATPKLAKPASRPKPASKAEPPADQPIEEAGETLDIGGSSGRSAGGASGTLQIADDEAAAPAPQRRAPVAMDKADTKDAAAPTTSQLLAQCEAAAARGDCPTAKRLAQKIQSQDPTVYRTRVVTSAAIKPCL